MTNSIIANAKKHFSEKPNGSIEVPEWGDGKTSLVIKWSPLTMAERRKIYADMENGSSPDGGTVFIRALILKSVGSDGKRLFSGMDEADISHGVDPDVVSRIGKAILGLGVRSQEADLDAVGND